MGVRASQANRLTSYRCHRKAFEYRGQDQTVQKKLVPPDANSDQSLLVRQVSASTAAEIHGRLPGGGNVLLNSLFPESG